MTDSLPRHIPFFERLWEEFAKRAYSTHARAWLGLLSFSESSFFIVPPEVLLLPIVAAHPKRWLWLGVYTSLMSVAGAIFGYVVAYFFFDTIGARVIEFYHLEEEFREVGIRFDANTFWVMFVAAFTPIPFKVFVLAGGFFKVSFVAFITASIIGRTARYLLIAYGAAVIGPTATKLALRYSGHITTVLLVLAALGVLAWYLLH